MKKSGAFAFVGLWMVSLASAGPIEGVRQILEGLREIIYLLSQFIFNVSWELGIYDQYIFAKLLLLLIIYLVVYTVVKKNKIFGSDQDKNPINIIISAAIAILSIKYLPNNLIEAILLQYSALGVGITVFLPLTIYFFFIHQSGIGYFGRRIGWLVFGASFIALWWSRYELLESANFIYWAGIIFIAFSLIFDKSIHKYFDWHGFRKAQQKLNRRTIWQLEDRLQLARDRLERGQITATEFEEESKEIYNAIKRVKARN